MHDVCIIGGGAAGMVCAVKAAERGRNVVLIEKNPALGKKIYATGNGRCNITNSNCKNAADVLAFFCSLGLMTKEEDEGRIYPASNQAADVVFFLEKRLAHLGVKVLCGHSADWVAKKKNGFEISCAGEQIMAANLVLALGGKAAPMYGTTGDGYSLAQSLGHRIVKPLPVLTAIETAEDLSALKGVRAAAECSLIRKGETVFKEAGEVQFTDYGLSGICIFNMSRYLLLDDETGFSDYRVSLDFCVPFLRNFSSAQEDHVSGTEQPDGIAAEDTGILLDIIDKRRSIPGFRNKDLLRSIVPQALAKDIIMRAGLDPDRPAGPYLKAGSSGTAMAGSFDTETKRICELMTSWSVTVKGAKGWKMAQCTKGGAALDEIDMETMESKICKGLFFAGELIDYDGPCGGYNLQNAWETGIRAGENI